MSKTHIGYWPGTAGEWHTECGLVVSPDDIANHPGKVTCGRCKRTVEYEMQLRDIFEDEARNKGEQE